MLSAGKLRIVSGFAAETVLAFGGILAIALAVSLLSPYAQRQFSVVPLAGLLEWTLVLCTCMATGFFEEGLFRAFIPKKLVRLGASETQAVLCQASLFSFFHRWEGLQGVFTAFITALFLAWSYKRHKRLAVIALAHGAYNFLVIWYAQS